MLLYNYSLHSESPVGTKQSYSIVDIECGTVNVTVGAVSTL